MKKLLSLLLVLTLLLSGCAVPEEHPDIAATTLPVWEFTSRLCEGTDLTVTRLVTESVSCLHDYSLNVNQVRSAEAADLIVISGAGLEDFMHDLLHDKDVIDASVGIEILECSEHHDHDDGHDHEGHHHETDSHIWLSPENAAAMARNICAGLCSRYEAYAETFESNLRELLAEIEAVQAYGEAALAELGSREIITFHDGFGYLAESFDLHILKAIEEESGAEASAAELKEMILMVEEHQIKAIFTEINGSVFAADIISAETGASCRSLDMAMAGDSYFDAMYHNIDTLKEALE